MDIWTERLMQRHIPLLERWIGRTDGALTPNDLPRKAEDLAVWFGACSADAGRLDCLISVYETPVGLPGCSSTAGSVKRRTSICCFAS